MKSTSKQFRKRNAILSCLQQTQCHPSAEMLYQMLQQEHPDISIATVYRNLSHFQALGLAVSLGQVDGVERFDAVIQPHAHLVCSCCGCVQDVYPETLPASLCSQAASELGWEIHSSQLLAVGLCPACREDGASAAHIPGN